MYIKLKFNNTRLNPHDPNICAPDVKEFNAIYELTEFLKMSGKY